MTEKQRQRLRDKIEKIKRTLTAEKRRLGCFDDSRGLRYVPTELYVKLGDFKAGLKYLKWFDKNFPDDSGFPEFLFESTIILFKTDNIKKAEEKALKTYFSNTFLFDKYFLRESESLDKITNSNTQELDWLKDFHLTHDQDDLLEFSDWLNKFTKTEKFKRTVDEFNEIKKELETEPVGQRRSQLVNRLYNLI
ncbi:MAG TPA: hypothetical protein PLV21_18605 [Cyclobacteriaceae bacterium]|mgnify:CR=1 FL=1|nr:hypothetical protein [Cyclobacteriaceae bacterium]HRJ83904.1 hypothetical protein [Cyclobacteriaceae bacterium]